MWLIHDVKGVSKLFLVLLLLIDFVLGALLSYVWTMGYYAPQEFHLPSKANVTIETVEFFAENATFFNITLLDPSYSPSMVSIEQIMVSTNDGLLHNVTNTVPVLRIVARGSSRTFQAFWNWGNYTGQTVNVIALVADGSGATFKATTPFLKLTVASVDFYPEVSVAYFNVTVESAQSKNFVDIETITINGAGVSAVAPSLPYRLEPNASITFRLERNWIDLQGKTVTVAVNTLQGYEAYRTVLAPQPVVLSIPSLVFNGTDTLHFNVTVHNDAASPAKVDIMQVKVDVLGESVTITEVSPPLPQPLQPNSDILLTCYWNWGGYQGQGVKATVTVYTQQGFSVSAEASIP